MDDQIDNIIRNGDFSEFFGALRCQKCAIIKEECIIKQGEESCLCCKFSNTKEECIFRRTITRPAWQKFYTWEEMNAENVLPSPQRHTGQRNTRYEDETFNTRGTRGEGSFTQDEPSHLTRSNNSAPFLPQVFQGEPSISRSSGGNMESQNTTSLGIYPSPAAGHSNPYNTRSSPYRFIRGYLEEHSTPNPMTNRYEGSANLLSDTNYPSFPPANETENVQSPERVQSMHRGKN
jgi:hypothetical protein